MAAVRRRSPSDPFHDQHRLPPLPAMPAAVPSSRDSSQHDITEAVRDTVHVRAKISRTHTAAVPPAQAPRPPGKRSQSEDSAIQEKSRSTTKTRPKKGSQHADVIDRLDFTGVGPMFHHDGPFDACAPSRNKHPNKAPMYSWGTDPAATPHYGDSAYPSAEAYKAFSNDYPEPPKRKVDAIAEAWGIHEPEPFEEFFAGGGSGRPDADTPASSIYNGRDTNHSASRTPNPPRRSKDIRDSRDDRPRIATRRSLVPPPQPIFVGEPADIDLSAGSPPQDSTGLPKRSKSLMHRIRKMRDSPNVPVGSDYDRPPLSPSSPTDPSRSPRPTHRSQNSFLGRFGGANRSNQSPPSEPFVYIEARNNNKDLPAPPPVPTKDNSDDSYPEHGGLRRKTSLMKKVGRVVRGTK